MTNSILAKMAVLISADIAEFKRSLADAGSSLKAFESTFLSIGRMVAGGLGFYSLTQAITGAVGQMARFEQSMSEVKAITQASGGEFDALRNNALNLAGAFKAIDISHLETEFGRLGFSTKEILDSTAATINLASATGSNLATSAVIAGSTLRAFNLEAEQMGRVADVMAGALNRSGLDMSNFAEAIKYVAPNAHAAYISLEQTAAMLGVLADNGIKGSMAGTTLRRIIQDLSTEAKPLNEKLAELGKRGLSAADAMTEIGRLGSTGLLILANNVPKIESLSEALLHVKGEAKAMSDVMQDNLIGDWNKFNAELDKTIQSGGFLNPMLRNITGTFTDLNKALNGSDRSERLLDRAMYEFNQMDQEFRDMPGAIKRVQEVATAAGKQIAFEWDAAGKSVKSVFFPMGAGAIGPDPAKKNAPVALGPFSPSPKMGTGGNDLDTRILGEKWVNEELAKSLEAATQKAIQFTAAQNEMKKAALENYDAIGGLDDGLALTSEESLPGVQSQVDALIAKYNELKKTTVDMGLSTRQMGRMMRTELTNLTVSFGQLLGNVFSGLSGENLGKVLLRQFGQVAVQLGHLLIGIGIGVEAFKESLANLDPVVAIAAGVALVALGTAFTNAASSASSGGGGVSSNVARAADSSRGLNLNISGQFTQSGSDMVMVLNQANAKLSRGG